MGPGRVLWSAQVAPCRSATCRHRAHGLTPPARTPPTAQVIRTTREVLRVPLPPVGPATARFDFLSRMERADSRSSAERAVPPDSRRGHDSRHRVRAYRGAAEIPTETLATYTARYRIDRQDHVAAVQAPQTTRLHSRSQGLPERQSSVHRPARHHNIAVGRQRGTGPFGRAGAETRRDPHEQGGGALTTATRPWSRAPGILARATAAAARPRLELGLAAATDEPH